MVMARQSTCTNTSAAAATTTTTAATRVGPFDDVFLVARYVRNRNLTGLSLTIASRPPLFLVLANNVQNFALLKRQIVRIATLEVKLSYHLLLPANHRALQWCGVEIVQLVERQQIGQIGERLVPDSVSEALVAGCYFVDDVVANFGIFPYAQHEITDDRGAIAHQKHSTFPLVHQQIRRFLTRHWPKVPARPIVHIEGCHFLCSFCGSSWYRALLLNSLSNEILPGTTEIVC
uniref:Uncharacterized protein n=1 Tax=Anopheles aquasalis TaxID=42839 RepID=T1DNQ4_ANOAQ